MAVVVGVLLLVGTAAPAGAEPTDGETAEASDRSGREGDPEEEEVEEGPDPAEVARQEARAALDRASERLVTARATLRARLAAVGAARAAGRGADGEVRHAEAPLPAAIADLAAAVTSLDDARRARIHLEEELVRLREELEVAREVLAGRAVRAFKAGHLAELSGPVAIAREAQDPGELAHHLSQLQGLTSAGARTVREVTAALDHTGEALGEAVVAEADAEVALEVAEATREAAEATAAAARGQAIAAEGRLLAALDAEGQSRAQVRVAIEGLVEATAEARDADVAAARVEAAHVRAQELTDEAAEDDDRAEEIAGRRRAHHRQVGLPAEHRRATADWRCPVAGGRFVNDWAFPRTGDRRHEGTDVFAPRGTAVEALTGGVVTRIERVERRGGLGGRTVSITAGDHRHYYAHLDVIPAALRVGQTVAAGEVIGTVGTTGNARSTPPHLHLGWYVRDTAVNPYASLAVACSEDGDDTSDEGSHLDRGEVSQVENADDQGWRTPSPARTERYPSR